MLDLSYFRVQNHFIFYDNDVTTDNMISKIFLDIQQFVSYQHENHTLKKYNFNIFTLKNNQFFIDLGVLFKFSWFLW